MTHQLRLVVVVPLNEMETATYLVTGLGSLQTRAVVVVVAIATAVSVVDGMPYRSLIAYFASCRYLIANGLGCQYYQLKEDRSATSTDFGCVDHQQ
jgi:hypothetical protein